MRVLGVHSYYRSRGGEDVSFESELGLLADLGHVVDAFTVSSAEMEQGSVPAQLATMSGIDPGVARRLDSRIAAFSPEVVYLNNWFPWLAATLDRPSLAEVPLLVAVRNYRLWCANALFHRKGGECRLCLTGSRLNGVARGCYRDPGRSAVAAWLGSKAWHSLRRSDRTHFAPVSGAVAAVLAHAGIPGRRIHIKPNVVYPAPPIGVGGTEVLFVGRLEPEKGLHVLERAARQSGVVVNVVGSGSLRHDVAKSDAFRYLGEASHGRVLELMRTARATVVPSTWGEPFGRIAAESLGCGTPIVAARVGGLAEIGDTTCAIYFESGNEAELVDALHEVTRTGYWAGEGRPASREHFDGHYSAEAVGPVLARALLATASSS